MSNHMENEIFIIDRTQIRSLRNRIRYPEQSESCVAELQRMIEIKSMICWRADARSNCCGADVSLQLHMELQFLERALQNIQCGNLDKAYSLLESYETIMPTNQ